MNERIALDAEAARRTAADGIPRYVTDDGRIMKCDWELSEEEQVDLDGKSLEEHIVTLMEGFGGSNV